MIIRNYKDKKYIETTDKEVIFYKWYGKRRFLKDKIRAAHMYDDYKVELLYGDNTIKRVSITEVKREDKVLLGTLFEELNVKENKFIRIIGDENVALIVPLSVLPYPILLNIKLDKPILVIVLYISLVLIIIALLILIQKKNPRYDLIRYDEKSKKIFLENIFYNTKSELKLADKILEEGKDNNLGFIKRLKANHKNMCLTNIIYPIDNKRIMGKIVDNIIEY